VEGAAEGFWGKLGVEIMEVSQYGESGGYGKSDEQGSKDKPSNDRELRKKLCERYKEAKAFHFQVAERGRQAHRFYSGDQWDKNAIAKLRQEGRPPVVINQVFKAINNVSGKQRDSRLSWRVLPRGENDVFTATAATKGLAYISDATSFRFIESRIFKEASIGPYGWVEIGYDESDPTREPIFAEYVPWDEMLVDPYGEMMDLSDARYIIRRKEVDFDIAAKAFPDKVQALKMAMVTKREESYEQLLGDYNNRDDGSLSDGRIGFLDESGGRKRVTLQEHHYWEFEDRLYVQLPDGERLDYEEDSNISMMAIQIGGQLVKGIKRCFYRAIMANETILDVTKSELPFDRFPYVCLWAFKDAQNKPYGIVEPMIWPQKELNVNRSRANESMRSRWFLYSQGAVPDLTEEQIANRLSRSNFAIQVNDMNGVQLGSDKGDLGGWMNLMETSRKEVDEVVGQNEAAYGEQGNEKSGRAIMARINQQSLNLGELWDNWRFFRLQVGRLFLALAIKYWPQEKWQRITEQSILQENEDAIRMAMMAGGQMPPQADVSWVGRAVIGINSLFRFDLKIEDQAETTTERQQTMQQAIELMGMLPDEVKASIVPDVIRMSDFENKEQMAARAEGMMMPQQPPPGMEQMAAPPEAAMAQGEMPPPPMVPEMMAEEGPDFISNPAPGIEAPIPIE
jgi:hypothetical protein